MESGLELDLVQEQLEALRQEMSRLATAVYRPRVTISSRRQSPFLGQSVVLDVTVSDPRTGQGLPDAAVILTTTKGVLRLAEGYQFHLGGSLSGRTDADGSLRVTLLPEGAEFMTLRHQEALNATLGAMVELTPEAATVGAVAERLARAYDWESNPDFREAADLLFARQPQVPEDFERPNLLPDSWPSQDAAIGAHLLSRQEDGSCEGSALLQLRFRNWLSAMVFQLGANTETGSDLDRQLQHVLRVTRGAPDLMGAFQQQVYRFVDRRRGQIGRAAGSAAARGILDRFVTAGLAEQEPDLRRALDAGLRATRAALNEQGGQALASLGDLRQELHSELGRQWENLDIGKVKGLQVSLNQLNKQVGSKVDLAAIEGLRGEIETRVGGLKAELNQDLGGRIGSLNSALEGLNGKLAAKVESAALEGLRGDLTARFKDTVSASAFADFSRNHAAQIEAHSGELKALGTGLAGFQAQTTKELNEKVDGAAFVVLRFGLLNNIKDLAKKVPNFNLLNSEILDPKLSSAITPIRNIDIDLGGVPIKIRPSVATPVILPTGGN